MRRFDTPLFCGDEGQEGGQERGGPLHSLSSVAFGKCPNTMEPSNTSMASLLLVP
jgi:hypothetical protein